MASFVCVRVCVRARAHTHTHAHTRIWCEVNTCIENLRNEHSYFEA